MVMPRTPRQLRAIMAISRWSDKYCLYRQNQLWVNERSSDQVVRNTKFSDTCISWKLRVGSLEHLFNHRCCLGTDEAHAILDDDYQVTREFHRLECKTCSSDPGYDSYAGG
ncbi:hypothetical protein BASA50_010085 [Batrachochytrium salamandrivorans]|uniref:Uncharacterized protein n=1 Tax=Batrachochytrium salamandrivorans TaxID=1357716 RepID=A0ABQ8EZF1_9FUNG|nr:hypothetical protein BASA50_010085 [Batrachochytrium salamandrivorans]